MLIALLIAFLSSLGGDGIQTLFSGLTGGELEALGIDPGDQQTVVRASEDLSTQLEQARGAWDELRASFSSVLRDHSADRADFARSAEQIEALLQQRYQAAVDARAKMRKALDAEQWQAVFGDR